MATPFDHHIVWKWRKKAKEAKAFGSILIGLTANKWNVSFQINVRSYYCHDEKNTHFQLNSFKISEQIKKKELEYNKDGKSKRSKKSLPYRTNGMLVWPSNGNRKKNGGIDIGKTNNNENQSTKISKLSKIIYDAVKKNGTYFFYVHVQHS